MSRLPAFAVAALGVLGTQAAAKSSWEFVAGNTTGCQDPFDSSCAGSYGALGVASASNLPGARCCAHTWTHDGKFYLFGGYGYDDTGNLGYLNDLWTFELGTKTWTWIAGATKFNQNNTATWPASRYYSSYGYDETSNSLYLYSGLGGDDPKKFGLFLKDTWRIDLGGKEITATQLDDSPGPGGRYWTSFWWANDKLWVLGGDGPEEKSYNDLWVWDPKAKTDAWEQVYDRSGRLRAYGVYTGLHQFPGQRENAFTSVDAAGSLWMFGGAGFGNNTRDMGDMNDVWHFNTTTREWRYQGGTPGYVNDPGNCGAIGDYGEYLPTARHAGFPVMDIAEDGKMYVIMGEHDGEKMVHADVWGLDVSVAHDAPVDPVGSYKSAVLSPNCNKCNTNSTYKGDDKLIGARFAGNTWVVTDEKTQQKTIYLYGGWGVDEAEVQNYVSDLWAFTVPK